MMIVPAYAEDGAMEWCAKCEGLTPEQLRYGASLARDHETWATSADGSLREAWENAATADLEVIEDYVRALVPMLGDPKAADA